MVERTLSTDDFYDLTRLTDVAISPDGERVAFTTSETNIESDSFHTSLFVVPTDGSQEPHRLTRASEADSPTWSPDGSKLGFLASREEDIALGLDATADDEDGEDEESGRGLDSPTQVWAFDLARGGDARQLTDFDEGVRAFDWGPDGERIVISARDPTDEEAATLRERREESGPIEIERLQYKADGQGYLDSVTTYLFVVDADSRETRRLDDAYGRGAAASQGGLQPAWGPERIAFRSYRGEDPETTLAQDAYLVSPDGSDAECLTDGSLAVGGFRWNSNGTKLAFVGDDPANVYKPTEAFVADIGGSYRSVSASFDRTLSWVGTPEWADEDTLVAPIGDEGWTRLARFHADGSKPDRLFESQGRHRTIGSFGLAGGTVALGLSDPTAGIDLHTASVEEISGETDVLTRLTELNDDLLDEVSLPTCERIRFENNTGDEIGGFAYCPADFDPGESEARPLVASIHGGPTTYDEPEFDFKHAYWASQGYVVLTVNYRGSTSYGRAFSEVIRGDWGPRESDDIRSGVKELVERGWVDPERLFLTGFSQGGINTAYVVARTDRFAAAAPEHGIYDFFSLYGTNDAHLWYENDVGLPWEVPEKYRAMSSIDDVDDIETPLLITAGEHDWRCPPTQAEQLYTSLKRRGVPSKLVVYQDEHHDVSRPKRATHRFETIAEWFKEHDPASDSNTNA